MSGILKSIQIGAKHLAFENDKNRRISQAQQTIKEIDTNISQHLSGLGQLVFDLYKAGEINHPKVQVACGEIIELFKQKELRTLEIEAIEAEEFHDDVAEDVARVCPNGHSGISPEALFCPVCGAKIVEQAVESQKPTRTCDTCGAPLNENARFCTKCGTSVTGTAGSSQMQEIPVSDEDTSQAAGKPPVPPKPPLADTEQVTLIPVSDAPAPPTLPEQMTEAAPPTVEVKAPEPVEPETTTEKTDVYVCPECGTETVAGAKFCPKCGAPNTSVQQPSASPIPAPPAPSLEPEAKAVGPPTLPSDETSSRICPDCGTETVPHAKFCPKCGHKY